jgi:hypothetical protein
MYTNTANFFTYKVIYNYLFFTVSYDYNVSVSFRTLMSFSVNCDNYRQRVLVLISRDKCNVRTVAVPENYNKITYIQCMNNTCTSEFNKENRKPHHWGLWMSFGFVIQREVILTIYFKIYLVNFVQFTAVLTYGLAFLLSITNNTNSWNSKLTSQKVSLLIKAQWYNVDKVL